MACVTLFSATPLDKLNQKQAENLLYIVELGKPYDLGYTLAAIAWKESDLCEHPMNLSDGKFGSFGCFHNLLESVAARHNVKLNGYNASRLAEQLVLNIDYSAVEALAELEFWLTKYKGNWRKAVASYNAGWNIKAGEKYMLDIAKKVKQIKKFLDQ
jgi:hypothetical protein